MKKIIALLIALPLLACCSPESFRNSNKYLPGYNFSAPIDMTLPLYTDLMYTGNPVYIGIAGYGINGIIVMKTGSGYAAWEASCPNQELTDCSMLSISGINAICPCDEVEYSLFTGQATTPVEYPLKPYRVEIISSTYIRVYN